MTCMTWWYGQVMVYHGMKWRRSLQNAKAQYALVWYKVWYGMWYEITEYGAVWRMAWCGMVYGMILCVVYGIEWYDYGVLQHDMASYAVWHGMIYGIV